MARTKAGGEKKKRPRSRSKPEKLHLVEEEVKQLKEWWSEPRWRFTKRPFTAEQIASKRGNLPIQYPSNAMSKKLWKILEQRFAVRS